MRFPSVAGSFYTASASQLRAEVKGYLDAASREVKAKERLAIVCPHAGFVYSGATAAYTFASAANWGARELTQQPRCGSRLLQHAEEHPGAASPSTTQAQAFRPGLLTLMLRTRKK